MRAHSFIGVMFFKNGSEYQHLNAEARYPDTYNEMCRQIEQIQAPCQNVQIDYEIIILQKNGPKSVYPLHQKKIYTWKQVDPGQLLKLVQCLPPRTSDPVSFEEAEECMRKVCPQNKA